jgi:hypothetical protein
MPATLDQISALSHAAMDAGLAGRAALSVVTSSETGVVIGAFQRFGDAAGARVRRVSGGPALRVAPGTVHVVLALRSCDALTPCEPAQLLNRYVRPLLRALTRHAALAHYFGREWISVLRRPAAFVGFAHDAESGRAAFEAFVAVHEPLWESARASFAGKEPASLGALAGRQLDAEALCVAIRAAYAGAYGELDGLAAAAPAPPAAIEPAWTARVPEAIGDVCAGPDATGMLRVGGEFMASRNAIKALEARLAQLGVLRTHDAHDAHDAQDAQDAQDAIAQAIDDALGSGSALFGVRDSGSIRDAIARATQ